MFHIFCWNRLNILIDITLSILEIIDFLQFTIEKFGEIIAEKGFLFHLISE